MSEFDRRGGLTRVRAEGRPRRHLRLLTAILAALALALLAPAASLAGEDRSGRSGDNAAQAINEKAGSSVFDFAFSIRRVAGDVVDEQNSAVAYGSCVECQTVAIALQIVLVEGVPDSVTPDQRRDRPQRGVSGLYDRRARLPVRGGARWSRALHEGGPPAVGGDPARVRETRTVRPLGRGADDPGEGPQGSGGRRARDRARSGARGRR